MYVCSINFVDLNKKMYYYSFTVDFLSNCPDKLSVLFKVKDETSKITIQTYLT